MYGPKTHCPKGHRYGPLNTYIDPKGKKRCRMCRRIGMAKLRRKRRRLWW
jgi:hypothetical protein